MFQVPCFSETRTCDMNMILVSFGVFLSSVNIKKTKDWKVLEVKV